MLFTTLDFVIFIAAAVVLFCSLTASWRPGLLLAASLAYAVSFGTTSLTCLMAVIAVAWATGAAIGRMADERARRAILAIGLVLVLGALAAFKLFDFLAAEVEARIPQLDLPRIGFAAPVGFSFYAFMAAAYMIDVFRRQTRPAGLAPVALYLSWFPKLLAGPIERAPRFIAAASRPLAFDADLATCGLLLILLGLIKKIVIADNLGPVVDRAFEIAPYAAPMDLAVAVYFFAFQIYCDFSGYSDIAIGLSLLFGIRLMENFRRPYLAQSPAEFWSSRWHISLGTWFRDYLYVPLGGSRAGPIRHYANVMLVFLVSGLWHAGLGYGVGWTFLIWGLLNGLYLWAGLALTAAMRRLSTPAGRLGSGTVCRIVRIVITFHLILVSWVFFRAESVDQAQTVLLRIVGALPNLPALAMSYPFRTEQAIGIALILALLCFEVMDERRPIAERLEALSRPLRWSAIYAGLTGLVVLGRWQSGTFIYMQF